jgi:hypothetical protein
MDGGSKTLMRHLICLRRMIWLTSLRMGGNVMNRGIAAAFVPETEPEETGLTVPTHRRRGWRRVATAAVATRRPGRLPVAPRRGGWQRGRGNGPGA